MTTSVASTGLGVALYAGGSGSQVTIPSYTASRMSLGVSQNAFGPLPGQAGGPIGPSTPVSPPSFGAVAAALGGNAPGILNLNTNRFAFNQVIPVYTYPLNGGSQAPWTTLLGKTNAQYNSPLTAGQLRWLVMEPDLTSGTTTFNPDYGTVLARTHNTQFAPVGTRALAYINMGFGSISTGTVQTNIDTAISLYTGGTFGGSWDGIFFDQAPGTQGTFTGTGPYQTYLTTCINYAAQSTKFGPNTQFWLNCGFWPDEGVMNLVTYNVGIVIENSYASVSGIDLVAPNIPVPFWPANYNPYRFVFLVHDCSATQMTAIATQIGQLFSSANLFCTDTAGSVYNPFPSYWTPTENNFINGA